MYRRARLPLPADPDNTSMKFGIAPGRSPLPPSPGHDALQQAMLRAKPAGITAPKPDTTS